MYHTEIITRLSGIIENQPARSAWSRGVKAYAMDLLEELDQAINDGYFKAEDIKDTAALNAQLLNGATDWNQYSWGGWSLIYDEDIARRLCCPSELKKTRNGDCRPNASEEWLDVQARALRASARHILNAAKEV